MNDHWLELWPPHDTTSDAHESDAVCILAHYEKTNQITLRLVHQLYYLSATSKVILVTQSRFTPSDVAFLEENYCCAVIQLPKSQGIDHTSYKEGFHHLRNHMASAYSSAKWVWFVNDSVLGPFGSLDRWRSLIKNISSTSALVYGLTISNEENYHIQSYFRAFKREVFVTDAFDAFIGKSWDLLGYHGVIRHGELSMLAELGIQPDAAACVVCGPRVGVAWTPNPTFSRWEDVLAKAMVVKIRMLSMYPQVRKPLLSFIPRTGMSHAHTREWLTWLARTESF